MKKAILIGSAILAAAGAAALIMRRKRNTRALNQTSPQMTKRSHHRVDVFAAAKNRNHASGIDVPDMSPATQG